jgi:hypothetical protein
LVHRLARVVHCVQNRLFLLLLLQLLLLLFKIELFVRPTAISFSKKVSFVPYNKRREFWYWWCQMLFVLVILGIVIGIRTQRGIVRLQRNRILFSCCNLMLRIQSHISWQNMSSSRCMGVAATVTRLLPTANAFSSHRRSVSRSEFFLVLSAGDVLWLTSHENLTPLRYKE